MRQVTHTNLVRVPTPLRKLAEGWVRLLNQNGNNGNANGVSGNGSGTGNIGNGNGNGGSVNNPDFIGNLKNIVTDAYPYDRELQGNRKNGKLLVYTEMLVDSTIYSNDNTMRAFYNQNKTATLGKLTTTEDLLAKGDVLAAQNKMQTTITTDMVEQTSLRFYELYITAKNNNGINSTDSTDLSNLANGCPERHGVAVYQARVLRNSLMDIYSQYEDNCAPTTSGSRLMQQSKNEVEMISSKNFILYPNPNNGKVFFTADNLGLSSFDINVYDTNGKQVFSQHYDDGVGVKNLQLSLANGLYSIHLTNTGNNATYIQKMVIQQ